MSYDRAVRSILLQLLHAPEWQKVAVSCTELDGENALVTEVVNTAAVLAERELEPFNRRADSAGCRLVDGRVQLPVGHAAVWQSFAAGGWTAIDGPGDFGGMGLPLAVHSACEELFNRANTAFGMLPTPIRCAARVIEKYASDELKQEWLPNLISGTWGATICISEADAGSDVPRLRTTATPVADGGWRLSGEKMWISFGDHDLTDRIGHMVLARTPGAPAGSAGLSLFLVPSTLDDGCRNAITVRRIEEKLGLHGSPTCELGFEEAQGWLIGERNRGLAQLFTMIIGMRLSVGSQGAGIAGACADLALAYAAERKQGGAPDAPPVTINRHGDVQRMLLEIAARAEVARGLVLTSSLISDLQVCEPEGSAKDHAGHLLAWMLPITKNFCAEAASRCAHDAIQVLGGAGFTREWPAEQHLRDARVLAIYEGTSGMQALDLVMRRVLGGKGAALAAFLSEARNAISGASDRESADRLAQILDILEVRAAAITPEEASDTAYPFLQLASLATTGWMALRLTGLAGTPDGDRLAALGRHWLVLSLPQAGAEAALVQLGKQLTANFALVEELA